MTLDTAREANSKRHCTTSLATPCIYISIQERQQSAPERPPVCHISGMVPDSSQFRTVLGRFASGVTIISVRGNDGQLHGMTVSSFASLSLSPPLVLACIDNRATMAPHITSAGSFGVSILTREQEELSRRFAEPLDNRFEGVGYHIGSLGSPLIDRALAWIECTVVERHPGGDHTILIGRVEHATPNDGEPLIFFRSGYATLD